MILKKRIENILLNYQIAREESKINMLEKIADDFAIGFAEWMGKKENLMHLIKIGYTTKELLEIYKKEKEL